MASSRHLKGSVLTRVRDLLKSGVLKQKPVWYDVVSRFPPLIEADLQRQPVLGQVKRIVYPEDDIRRKFFSIYQQEAISLSDSNPGQTMCDRFVEKCLELVDSGVSETEAFHETVRHFADELTDKKTPSVEKKARPKAKQSMQTLYDLLDIKNTKANNVSD